MFFIFCFENKLYTNCDQNKNLTQIICCNIEICIENSFFVENFVINCARNATIISKRQKWNRRIKETNRIIEKNKCENDNRKQKIKNDFNSNQYKKKYILLINKACF